MAYVYRVRRLVKLVYDETNDSLTRDIDNDSRPTIDYIIARFCKLSKRYNDEIARATLAVATGGGYLGIDKSKDQNYTQQRLVVKDSGIKLLTPLGYINALCGSVSDILPVVAIIISIVALSISIIALIKPTKG